MTSSLAMLFAALVSPMELEVIENPVVESIQFDSQEEACWKEEIIRQIPDGIMGSGEVYIIGPQVRRDLKPIGSVLEFSATIPNKERFPMFKSLSIWLETHDKSVWEQKTDSRGHLYYSAKGLLNPAKVFEKVQFRFLFDLDLKPCL